VLGLANAALFNRTAYIAALASEDRMSILARVAGALSLIFWSAALVFACLNTEAMPNSSWTVYRIAALGEASLFK
jgi:hypothetical protein